MARKPIRLLPWSIYTADPIELAGYLIDMAGGPQPARDAITRANALRRKARGRPSHNDTAWLLAAAAIQRRDHCTESKALSEVANMFFGDPDKVRHLRRKLNGKSLAEFAQDYPDWAVRPPVVSGQ